MPGCVLVGREPDVRALSAILEDGGVEHSVVERVGEAEHVVAAGRAEVVIVADSTADHDAIDRLRRAQPERLFVAWLPHSSTSRAAQLFRRGFVEVLDATMGGAELLARLANAAARRPAHAREPVRLGLLRIDAAHGVASWGETELRLTRRERELLEALAAACPRTLRREELYRSVWGYAMARGDRTVDVNVTRLRAKLTAVTHDVAIATEPGVGYRLEVPLHVCSAAVTRL